MALTEVSNTLGSVNCKLNDTNKQNELELDTTIYLTKMEEKENARHPVFDVISDICDTKNINMEEKQIDWVMTKSNFATENWRNGKDNCNADVNATVMPHLEDREHQITVAQPPAGHHDDSFVNSYENEIKLPHLQTYNIMENVKKEQCEGGTSDHGDNHGDTSCTKSVETAYEDTKGHHDDPFVNSDDSETKLPHLQTDSVMENVKKEQCEGGTSDHGGTSCTRSVETAYEETKTNNSLKFNIEMATPVAVRKVMNSDCVKSSPNTPGYITDKMIEEERIYQKEEEQQVEEARIQALEELARTGQKERFDRLQSLLNRSEAYSTYLLGRVNARREEEEKRAEKVKKKKLKEADRTKDKDEKQKLLETQNDRVVREKCAVDSSNVSSDEKVNNTKKRKRKSMGDGEGAKGTEKNKKSKGIPKSPTEFVYDNSAKVIVPTILSNNINKEIFPEQQPKLLTGGPLRNYQVEGMEWLIGLYENGINGILADEMGLGKTLQSIALICKLIEQNVIGPYLIAAPLSTLPNWISEFKKFAPEIYTILYHGTKEGRFEKRQKMMRIKRYSHGLCSLPVVISSYEVLMRDRVPLSAFDVEWKYLIVDEGHRIKNLNCKLIKELKLYNTGNRLLLTGTPLQNNLSELWSLLNFLLPDIFDDLSSFQQWFDFSALSSSDFIADEQEAAVLQTLHSILNPFLLRRLKTEVDLSIPPKKEILVYCPMTAEQQSYYKTTLDRTVLDMISEKNSPKKELEYTASGRPKRHSTKNTRYTEYEDEEMFDFDLWIKQLEDDESRRMEILTEKQKREEKKAIINVRLVNVMMQLRKCCNHPYLLEYPYDAKTNELIIDDRLLKCSGKLLMLDKMLEALIARGHKVLVFSQMTLMLDIIVDFLNIKKRKYSRLDGTMKVEDRHINIETFNNDPDTCIFLLSTRAGGLGLNLMMADTCIIYDSDWNPQVDLQAQDRCHRIGQTKPVIIYRLVTTNTIDERIIERAATKRKLEKMVIHEKRFKGKALAKALTPAELIKLLESSDVSSTLDTQNFITDEQLEQLLDRSDLYRLMDKSSEEKVPWVEGEEEENAVQEVPLNHGKLFTVVETCISDKVIF